MYQKLILIGNIGSDAELRYLPDGTPVCTFSLADSRVVKKGVDETTWTWNKLAETCNQHLHKGSKVLVEGRLKADAQGNPRTYERKDGSGWSASFEVAASSVKFLSGKDEPADEETF